MINFIEVEKDFIKNLISYAINSNYILPYLKHDILKYNPLYEIDDEDLSKISLKELKQLKDDLDKNKVFNGKVDIVNDLLYFAEENNFIDYYCVESIHEKNDDKLEKISKDKLQNLIKRVEKIVEQREINDILYSAREHNFIND